VDVVPSKDGRATLATVAASAGVSVATVSKVVNGRTDVGPETRALVESLLRQHDYIGRRPPPRRSPATATIELLFTGDFNAYSIEIIQGVLDAAEEGAVAAAISVRPRGHRRSQAGRFSAWARDLAAAGRRAVIAVTDDLTTAELRALSRAHLPLVVIDPLEMPHSRVTSVGSTNFAGGLAATRHLLSLGHRRIAYIGGPVTAACNQARMHGYRAALEAAGAPAPEEYIRTGNFRYQDGFVGGAALLGLPEPPTAVFAGSDETASGVIEAARARGLRIPEDLSLVGFDDTEVARFASPPLTTVRQPLRKMGSVALRTALRLAAGEKLDSHHVELATELVVRRSTAPPPAAGSR
jgi:LacI family transcriptional regulator